MVTDIQDQIEVSIEKINKLIQDIDTIETTIDTQIDKDNISNDIINNTSIKQLNKKND